MGEVRHFKFGGLVCYSMSQPAREKPPLKGAWSGSRGQLYNMHGLATRSTNLQMTNCHLFFEDFAT